MGATRQSTTRRKNSSTSPSAPTRPTWRRSTRSSLARPRPNSSTAVTRLARLSVQSCFTVTPLLPARVLSTRHSTCPTCPTTQSMAQFISFATIKSVSPLIRVTRVLLHTVPMSAASSTRPSSTSMPTIHTDVVIDLIGYRKYGHNEIDEPMFTQPLMYQVIKKHKNVFEMYSEQLINQGVVNQS